MTSSVLEAVELLQASPDFKVLRRFQPRDRYTQETWNLGEAPELFRGVFVDVEATGLDRDRDEIIELGMLPFSFDKQGRVYDVGPDHSWLEAPKVCKISSEIAELTGITPEMVKGQKIDDAAVTQLLEGVAIVIAHNADYDRQMLEPRLSAFKTVRWACSMRDVDWQRYGVAGVGLATTLIQATGEFPDNAHRALDDCHMGVHLLAAAVVDDKPALSELLDSIRIGTTRVCAMGSPMEAKSSLQARHYRACYRMGRFQYWYKDVRPAEVEAECEWARTEAYSSPQVVKISAFDRYSVRAT